jgi:hypothetical protein
VASSCLNLWRCLGNETWLLGEVEEGEVSWKLKPGYMVKRQKERRPGEETLLFSAVEDVTCRRNLAIWSSVRGRVGRMNNISTHSPSYTVPLVLPCTLQRINRWRFATLQYCLFQQCNVKLNIVGKQLPKLIEMSWKHNVAIW